MAENLCKQYPRSGCQSLSGVSFSVPYGRILSVTGDNGSGKSTLAGILAGTIRKTSGHVSVLGRPPGKSESVGFLPQRMELFGELTVKESVDHYCSCFGRKTASRDLIRFTGIDGFADKRISSLSGGMRRRAAIACILAGDPELVIMDEPSAGLDRDSSASIWDLISALRSAGKTIVVATHEAPEAWRRSDIMLNLENGRIQHCGDPKLFDFGYTVSLRSYHGTDDIAGPETVETYEAADLKHLRMILDDLARAGVPDERIRIEERIPR